MLRLALKNGLYRPARTLLTVVAVAAILAEILMLEGFMSGTYTQLRQNVLRRGGDLVVGQAGIPTFIAARSVLPQQARAAVEAQPGVAAAHPITSLMLIYEKANRLSPIIVTVFDDAGGPDKVVMGRAPQASGEIVIDRALAKRYGLGLGDTLTVAAYDFTITGMTQGAAAIFTPFAFITFDALIDFYFASDVGADIAAFPLLSFLLVDVTPGVNPASVAAEIEANVPEADVFLPGDLAGRDENLGREMFGPILGLLLGLSYAIGALAIGLFSFAAVRSRRKNLGVLRALGFNTGHLAAGIVFEALLTVLLAIPLGVLLANALAGVIQTLSPVYLIQTNTATGLWRTAAVAIVLAILGGLAPLGAMRRLDPATAFRG